MLFSLQRLPLLAIIEVIKSMDTREIFLLSLLSKKSQNLVMLSIPKHSLSAEFTFKKHGFLFELMPKGFIKKTADILSVVGYITKKASLYMRFSTCGRYCQYEYTSQVDEPWEPFHFLSKTFKKSKICLKFEHGTKEEFAMELARFYWENGFPLDRINFSLDNASSKSIHELLNGCDEHHTSLEIETQLPEDFKCTPPPPGGYKFESISVDYAHWVNLDDFLQCRKVFFVGWLPDFTPDYLNGFLKKIVNLECRIERFTLNLKSINPSDFPAIVSGLSDSAIRRNGRWQGFQFERKDGRKLLISLSRGHLDLQKYYL